MLILIGSFSFYLTVNKVKRNISYIQTGVAPSGAMLKIDGKGIRTGTRKVLTGSYTITASKKGFATITKQVITKTNQTTYISLVLQPNTTSTKNWYLNHPADEKLAEAIGDHLADYEIKIANQQNPFLSQLPTSYGDGLGGFVNISQGIPITNGGQPAIYISAANPTIRQGVLQYINNRGYDTAEMVLVFNGENNPLDGSNE